MARQDIHTDDIDALLSAIEWPIPDGASSPPRWEKGEFFIDGARQAVLQFAISDKGWSDDLGSMVEHDDDPNRPFGKASRRHTLSELRRQGKLGKGNLVMEIGCTTGKLLRDINSTAPDTALVATDFSNYSLERLSENLRGVPLIQLDLTRSPLPTGIADAIVNTNVLEHIEDDVAALREIHRMLKPGGIAVIEVPFGAFLFDSFDSKIGHYRRYDMTNLKKKAQGAGFEILSSSYLGFFIFPLFAIVKKRNRMLAKKNDKKIDAIVETSMKQGRKSVLMDLLFSLERLIRPLIAIPFGVRCLITVRAKKPQ